MKRTKTDTIVIHCSATQPSMDIGATKIREWHTKPRPAGRGWRDIGYHGVIRRDGTFEKGRNLDQVGAHVRYHNDHSIGICMVGGVDASNKPESNFTKEQYETLRIKVKEWLREYPGCEVVGHHDLYDGKACPSFNAKEWWNGTT